jgi:nucleoside-diphosphate-sugar epimerase
MKSALLTGATGFIGSHLARALLAAGYEVVATVRPGSSLARIHDIKERLRLYDLGAGPLDGLFTGGHYDAVLHLATAYGKGGVPHSEVLAANTLFPLRLLEAAVRASVPLFVAADTCFTPDYKYLQAYTLSKRQFAQWGKAVAEAGGIRFVNLKLYHPYGPDDSPDKFIPMIVRQCRDAKEILLTSGEQCKDFIHVADVVRAYLTILEHQPSLDEGFSEIECGSGKAVSVRSLVEMIHRLSRSQALLRFGALPQRQNEVAISRADPSRLISLGWRPAVSLEEGFLRLLEAAPSASGHGPDEFRLQ